MTVFCQAEEGKWYKDGECDRGTISLDCDNECECFESYLDDAEWQKPYWKRLINRDTKQIYRVLFHGKEIEVKGRKFYVDVNSDYAIATDGITGLGCGHICEVENRLDQIIELCSKNYIPPLETLPIGEYDEKTRKVTPKQDNETEKGGEQK